MAPSESVSRATVTDLDTVRRTRARVAETATSPAFTATESATTRSPTIDPATRVSGTGTTRKPANRRFDAEKVERLKAEIADGRYRIDAESVADRFIEHERNN